MAKSKKGQRTAKAGRRPAAAGGQAKAGGRRAKAAGVKRSRGAATPVARAKATPKRAPGRRAGVRGATTATTPSFAIRELDPLRLCGGGTSVVQLFRADEVPTPSTAAKGRQIHLVFNDRHGWYCEHGRSCHAVSAVMRHAGIR